MDVTIQDVLDQVMEMPAEIVAHAIVGLIIVAGLCLMWYGGSILHRLVDRLGK